MSTTLGATDNTDNTDSPTAVLVHGAFADASGFGGVIRALTAAGHEVLAPPNPLRGVAHDAAAVRAVVSAIDGPVVLVGHSYGGAVISQASAGLRNVVGLVYLAAFAPDVGESAASVQEPFETTLLASTVRPTPYEAPGAAGGPDLFIDRDGFRDTFAADSTVEVADVLFVTQRPLAAAAFSEELTAAGWHDLPTWFQVSADDHAIDPEAQRFMAQRMGATVDEVAGSHTAFIAQPGPAAALIEQALGDSGLPTGASPQL